MPAKDDDAAQPRQQHRNDVLVSAEGGSEPEDTFPTTLLRKASSKVGSIFKRASKLGFGLGRADTRHPAASARASETQPTTPSNDDSFVRENTNGTVDVKRPAVPTAPASVRTTFKSPRELAASVKDKAEKNAGSPVGPMRRLRTMCGIRDGVTSGALTAARQGPWAAHQGMSRTLTYRPRGHGRAFKESYDVGDILGSGGFAVVLEGDVVKTLMLTAAVGAS